ncbi:MAG: hypothetical protein WC788_03745 [Candidatus Paceibacterota bacterium]
MRNLIVLLLIVLALAAGVLIGISAVQNEQSCADVAQKQVEKKKVEFYRADAREYHVYYSRINNSANNSINVNVEFYLSVQFELQLNNEVVMQYGDILSFTNLDQEDEVYRHLVIVYLGFHPEGGAIIKEFGSVRDAKKYVNETTGKYPALINVIKRKTGD